LAVFSLSFRRLFDFTTYVFLPQCLGTLTTDTASKLNVLRHDSDTLGVDGTQVRILEKTNKIQLGSLL
jgi:hypothetical protein